MADVGKRKKLGRGLDALFSENEPVETAPSLAAADPEGPTPGTVAIERLVPGRYQPRRHFAEDELKDLSESIRSRGILQPILVRIHSDVAANFEIIAGERRWRAAQLAQLHEVPVIIRELSDAEALEIALVENLQREDLSPLEEADAYHRLMEEFSHTQEALAEKLGKSRSHVANTMRLLALPDPIKNLLEEGQLSVGHARALLNADDPLALAKKVVRRDLNVRQTEKLAKKGGAGDRQSKTPPAKDTATIVLERDLSTLLGLKADIDFKGQGGRLILHCENLDQLDDILHRLSGGAHGRPVNAMANGSISPGDSDLADRVADTPPKNALISPAANAALTDVERDLAALDLKPD